MLSILQREPIDAVASDFTLFGGLFAAEKVGIPAAMLVHTVYPFPAPGRPPYGTGWAPMGGPIGALRDAVGHLVFRRIYERPLLPRLNQVRARLGLRPVSSLADLINRQQGVFVLTSPAFDFGGQFPPNVRYLGPQLEEADRTAPWQSPWPATDRRPLVVVGLTTTHQAHRPLLERIVAALGTLPVRAVVSTGAYALGTPPGNVHLTPSVPHPAVMPHANVVVTHAGLGTAHAALASGCPMVCLPIGRDQPDNAARVVWHGAGVRLSPKSRAPEIAAAVDRVLTDGSMAERARRLAAAIADELPAERGAAELERLAAGTNRAEPAGASSRVADDDSLAERAGAR